MIGTDAQTTMVAVCRRWAEQAPLKRAYTFLSGDGPSNEAHLSYGELDLNARMLAAGLQQRVRPGDRVLLLYRSGLDFIVAFFGCLYAGVVAVPVAPPSQSRSGSSLSAIIADAQASMVLTTAELGARLDTGTGALDVPWRSIDTSSAQLDDWREPAIGPESLAFLQYTSGSTSAPKGAMVSHRNLLANLEVMRVVFSVSEQTVTVSWLPLFHDMGLIGMMLCPLFLGAYSVLMSPLAFLQSPVRWLKAVTRYRGTVAASPNFGYELCARRIQERQRAELDLTSWKVAITGAEPIRPEVLERFADIFASCGFRRQAFYPCYGLAEATLLVTGDAKGSPPTQLAVDANALERNVVRIVDPADLDARALAGCGAVVQGTRVEIVDPETLVRRPPGSIGEIWVSGPSVVHGYWRQPELTESLFQVRLADTGEGPFLRTGDLGFLHEGGLFVTGRLKDLIIIDGRNHYPQDIEATAERCHPAVRAGGCAAFSVDRRGQECLVLAVEVDRRELSKAAVVDDDLLVAQAILVKAVRRAVAEEHAVQVSEVVFLGVGQIPRTSSGKLRRQACRATVLDGASHDAARVGAGAGGGE